MSNVAFIHGSVTWTYTDIEVLITCVRWSSLSYVEFSAQSSLKKLGAPSHHLPLSPPSVYHPTPPYAGGWAKSLGLSPRAPLQGNSLWKSEKHLIAFMVLHMDYYHNGGISWTSGRWKPPLKGSLSKIRETRMDFFMDWSAEPWASLVGLWPVRPHKVSEIWMVVQ